MSVLLDVMLCDQSSLLNSVLGCVSKIANVYYLDLTVDVIFFTKHPMLNVHDPCV